MDETKDQENVSRGVSKKLFAFLKLAAVKVNIHKANNVTKQFNKRKIKLKWQKNQEHILTLK